MQNEQPATWNTLRADFAFDGAFIDLLVPGTDDAAWKAFWSALRDGPFRLQAFRDGEPIPLPESVDWVFAECQVAWIRVSVQSGNVTANCHLWGGDMVLDINPREITTEDAFLSVLAIMRFMAATVRLPVLAVVEGGSPEYAFLRVTEDGQARFLKAGSVRHAEPDDDD